MQVLETPHTWLLLHWHAFGKRDHEFIDDLISGADFDPSLKVRLYDTAEQQDLYREPWPVHGGCSMTSASCC